MKFCPVVPEICRGQVHGARKERIIIIIIIIRNGAKTISLQTLFGRLNESKKCEGEITIEECTNAICKMKLNKAPGLDGLSVEFYRKFWNNLKKLLQKHLILTMRGDIYQTHKKLGPYL